MPKDKDLLGVNPATANYQLHRRLVFAMAQQLNLAVCFRCGHTIVDVSDLSIEHKKSWRSAANPRAAFFDLENVAFSHLRCNCAAGGGSNKKYATKAGRKTAYSRRNKERWNRQRRDKRHDARSASGRLRLSESRHEGSNPSLAASR